MATSSVVMGKFLITSEDCDELELDESDPLPLEDELELLLLLEELVSLLLLFAGSLSGGGIT